MAELAETRPEAREPQRRNLGGTADSRPGGYEHPRSGHSNALSNILITTITNSHISSCANSGFENCKCCELWPAIVGTEGARFSKAKAKAKANAQGNGSNIGANANEVGPEGNCNRKGAIATYVRSEARSKHRMLRRDEANVGTEVNNHVDDLSIMFAHLHR